jgi:hypothetical protein
LGLKILRFFDADPDPGFGILSTLDPGWKNSDPESGINIADPQHCGKESEKLNAWNGLKEPYSPSIELFAPFSHTEIAL